MGNNNEVNNLEKENLKNEQTNINKGKNNKKKLWIIISIIIVIAIAGIIVYATFTEDNCTNNNTYGEPYFDPEQPYLDKPIIYLYPQNETNVSVNLGNNENITC